MMNNEHSLTRNRTHLRAAPKGAQTLTVRSTSPHKLHRSPLEAPFRSTCKWGHARGCGKHWEVKLFAKKVV